MSLEVARPIPPPAPDAAAGAGALEVRLEERASDAARCAYCHDAQRGALVVCPRCGVVLHAECRAPLGRCMTLGCTSLAALPTDGPQAEAEVYRPRASWFDLRDPLVRNGTLLFIALSVAAAGLFALFGLSAEPTSIPDDVPWWLGFSALVATMLAAVVIGNTINWRVGLRITRSTPPLRRFVTLARVGRDGWRLQLRVRSTDVSPSEVIDVTAQHGQATDSTSWIRRLAPHTPMTAHGLETHGAVALVDPEGRLHAVGTARRVDSRALGR